MKKIDFELGGIAYHCLQVYLDDPKYYDDYILVGVETTSSRYKISRGVRVGSNIARVMNKYKIDNYVCKIKLTFQTCGEKRTYLVNYF